MSAGLDLLAFGPHPDDVELSCGGWVARATVDGHRVGVVDLTAGELATNGDVVERAAEADAAARALGLTLRENLGLPDGGLRADDDAQVDAVVEVLRRLRPSLVLAPWIEARHPDHAAAGRLIERAVFFAGLAKHRPELGAPARPGRLVFYPQRHEARPDFVVDVTTIYPVKQAAIACHATQFGAGGAKTLVNAPVGLGAFEARDRYWGATIGVPLGEPYLLRGPVPLTDPVAHFAAHPHPPALVPPR